MLKLKTVKCGYISNFSRGFQKNKNKTVILLLVLVLAIGAFFRFYNYKYRLTISADSSRDAFVAIEGSKRLQLPLTGPFISIAPVTTGPWYWYILIFTRIISRSMYSPWIMLGLISMSLLLIMYRIGMLLESKMFGLILSLIVALSPQQITTAYLLTNPSIIGTFSALVILIYLEISLNKRPSYWGLFLGFITGVTINTHFQAIVLLFFPLILFFSNRKTFFYALLGLFITTIPLLIFELNNHWFNTVNMLDYLRFGQYRIWTSNRWLTYLSDFWPRFWIFVTGGTKFFGVFLILCSGILFIFKLIKTQNRYYLVLGLNFLISLIMVRYYRGEKFFGYLQFFHPFIFISTGLVLYSIYKIKYRIILFPIACLVYISLVLPSALQTLASDSLNVKTNLWYQEIISKWGNKQFAYYDCRDPDIDRSRALGLILDLKGNLNAKSENKLFFYWGHCYLPNYLRENKIIDPKVNELEGNVFPSMDVLRDVSIASEGAILESGGIRFSSQREYQSAARWWFDEQP